VIFIPQPAPHNLQKVNSSRKMLLSLPRSACELCIRTPARLAIVASNCSRPATRAKQHPFGREPLRHAKAAQLVAGPRNDHVRSARLFQTHHVLSWLLIADSAAGATPRLASIRSPPQRSAGRFEKGAARSLRRTRASKPTNAHQKRYDASIPYVRGSP